MTVLICVYTKTFKEIFGSWFKRFLPERWLHFEVARTVVTYERFYFYYTAPNPSPSDLSCLDLAGARTLIIIQSAPSNRDRRDSDRRTWMELLPADAAVVFLFGTDPPPSDAAAAAANRATVAEEAGRHCDMVQMDFVDSYENVTLDTVSALKFALSWPWEEEPEFVVVGDDDTYVNVPRLMDLLYNTGRMTKVGGS